MTYNASTPNRGGTDNRSGNNDGGAGAYSDKIQLEHEQGVRDAMTAASRGKADEEYPGQFREMLAHSTWREPAGEGQADADMPSAWLALDDAGREAVRRDWKKAANDKISQRAQGSPALSQDLNQWLRNHQLYVDGADARARMNRRGEMTTLEGLFVGADETKVRQLLKQGVPSVVAQALLEQVPKSRELIINAQGSYSADVNHLLLQGANDSQKARLAGGKLPEADHLQLAHDPNPDVRLAVAQNYHLKSDAVNEIQIKDSDPAIRGHMASVGTGGTAFADRLADDVDPDVRAEVVAKGIASLPVQLRLVNDPVWKVRAGQLSGRSPVEVQAAAGKHRDWKTRIAVAMIGGGDKEVLKRLTRDFNPLVNLAARAAVKNNAEADAVIGNVPGAREAFQRKLDLQRAREQVRRLQ
jgi:hypothetical protein